MAKLPAFQFYPADWRKDPGVQALSYHDRGVWFEILCLMHESEQRGKLLLNGQPMPEAALAQVLGIDKEALRGTLAALLQYGVASLDDVSGALICRRMIRDEAQREVQKAFGKQGGNPALTRNYNKPGFVYAVQRASDGWVKIGISEKPTKRLYKLRYQFKSDNLEMLAFRHVEDMGAVEAELHAKYNHLPNSGEWFDLTGEPLEDVLFTLKGKRKGGLKGKQTPSSSSSTTEEKESTTIVVPKKSGTRIPDPFLLTPEMRSWAKDRRPDVDLATETEKFCNYWRAKTGRDATKLDWSATWRNWILNAKPARSNQNGTTVKNHSGSAERIRQQDLSDLAGLDPIETFGIRRGG